MSETHHTTTTTTTTTYHTTSIAVNVNFVTSLPGILKIIELICGLLCWALTAGVLRGYTNAAFGYIMFVSVTAWVLTLISFFIFLMGIHATTCSGAPWAIMEFAFNTFWAVAYFIAACVSASHTLNIGTLAAAAAFAFFTDFAYIAHALVSFKEWRGGYPWIRGASAGATVNA